MMPFALVFFIFALVIDPIFFIPAVIFFVFSLNLKDM